MGRDMVHLGAWKEEKGVAGFSASWAGRYHRTEVGDLSPCAPTTCDNNYNLDFNELSAKNPSAVKIKC